MLAFPAGDLNARRPEVWATGQAPHYDVVYIQAENPDALDEASTTTPYVTLTNPRHDPDGGSDA